MSKRHNPPEEIPCGCGGTARPVKGDKIYPHLPHLHGGTYFRCQCGAYVGTHRASGQPLGTPAGPETRKARNAAHAAFDPLWKGPFVPFGRRADAYRWLAEKMGVPVQGCHVAMFSAEQCRAAVRIIQESEHGKRRSDGEAVPEVPVQPGVQTGGDGRA